MKLSTLLAVVFGLVMLLGAAEAYGQEIVTVEQEGVACMSPSVCVPKEDLAVFVELLREKKCLQATQPKVAIDQIQLFVDKDGRVFHSGAVPHPYTMTVDWCNYQIKAEGHLKVYAAVQEPPIWGFRLRPKAYMGLLLAEPFYGALPGEESPGLEDTIDAGFMADFLYYDFVNLNATLGLQSFGGALGFDLTKNFGVHVGYGLKWGSWHHNPSVGLYFGF